MIALARLIATWFYCGLFPKAPGTVGSVAALLLAIALNHYLNFTPLEIGVLGLLVAIPGVWAADVTAKSSGKKDPQIVVVDEVAGQWITIAGAVSVNWKSWLLALALFRIFDI